MKFVLPNNTEIVRGFDGVWYVVAAGRSYALKESADFWRIVSLLEHSYKSVRPILGPDFSYSEVILAALDSKSEYWIGLGILWAGGNGFRNCEMVLNKLNDLVFLDQLSQSDKKRVRDLLSK